MGMVLALLMTNSTVGCLVTPNSRPWELAEAGQQEKSKRLRRGSLPGVYQESLLHRIIGETKPGTNRDESVKSAICASRAI
jgi:hypothetical protein